ncbi:uncharacterized [Tachysurus ichikawai]
MALLGNKSTTTNLDNELYRYLGGDITAGAVDNRHICNRRIVIFSTVLEFSPETLSMRKCSVPEVIPLAEVLWHLSRGLNF